MKNNILIAIMFSYILLISLIAVGFRSNDLSENSRFSLAIYIGLTVTYLITNYINSRFKI